MGTTKQDLSDWFDTGVAGKATHMIVVCDTFEHEDYPVYAGTDDEALKAYDAHNGENMQRVMEVYDLRMDKTMQLEGGRAFNLPRRQK